jgi:hypothetical protein
MDSDIHFLHGVSALKLAYKGSVGYLKHEKLPPLIAYKKIIIGI